MTNKERQDARFKRDREKRLLKRQKFEEQYTDYEKIISIEELDEAFRKCKKGVGWKTSIQSFEINKLREYIRLHNTLLKDGNISKGYTTFTIMERGKERKIEACHITERVVQKSFSDNCFTPIFDKYVIENNCASQVGKGTSKAVELFKEDLIKAQRKFKGDFYILQGDLTNYFGSIPHDQLINMLNEYIHNEHIRTFYTRHINRREGDAGIGLGSQNNQNFAALYLNDVDHYITNQLHQKFYGRYNDDFYLMVATRDEAKKYLEIIKEKIEAKGLTLSVKKTKIVKSTHMITYLKQRFTLKTEGRVIIRPNKKSAIRLRRKLKAFAKKLKAHKMSYADIYQSFKSAMGVFKDRSCYKVKEDLCNLFNSLFIDDWCHNLIERRVTA